MAALARRLGLYIAAGTIPLMEEHSEQVYNEWDCYGFALAPACGTTTDTLAG